MTKSSPFHLLAAVAVAPLLVAGMSAAPAAAETTTRTTMSSRAAASTTTGSLPSWISMSKSRQAMNCSLRTGPGTWGLAPWPAAVRARIGAQFGMQTIGGYREGVGTSDHHTGHALDVMVRGQRGDRIADWVRANASTLNVKYVIWEQGYWHPGMSGYRPMEDRGSETANHYDHVHISFHPGWGDCPA